MKKTEDIISSGHFDSKSQAIEQKSLPCKLIDLSYTFFEQKIGLRGGYYRQYEYRSLANDPIRKNGFRIQIQD